VWDRRKEQRKKRRKEGARDRRRRGRKEGRSHLADFTRNTFSLTCLSRSIKSQSNSSKSSLEHWSWSIILFRSGRKSSCMESSLSWQSATSWIMFIYNKHLISTSALTWSKACVVRKRWEGEGKMVLQVKIAQAIEQIILYYIQNILLLVCQ